MAKRYIENNLNEDEHVILEARISWWTLVPPILWAAFMVAFDLLVVTPLVQQYLRTERQENIFTIYEVVSIFLEFGPLFGRILRNRCTSLAVTNKRVIGKTGVFTIQTVDFQIDRVRGVSYHAGFFGNIFRYFKIEVKGSGTANRTPTIPGVSNAAAFKNSVSAAAELHSREGRKDQARLIGEAIVEAMRKCAFQLVPTAPSQPEATYIPEDERPSD